MFERLQVDEHVAQRRELRQQLVLDDVADAMPLGDAQVGSDFDVDVGEVFEPRFSHPQRLHAQHAIDEDAPALLLAAR